MSGVGYSQASILCKGYQFGKKNSFTRTLRKLDWVIGHEQERNQCVAPKWSNAQIDETVSGTRKYEQGHQVRQLGAQWALTMVEVDPDDGRTIQVNIQFLDRNRYFIKLLLSFEVNIDFILEVLIFSRVQLFSTNVFSANTFSS